MLLLESEIIEYKFKHFLQIYYKKSMGKDVPLDDSIEFLMRDDIPYLSDWLIEVHIDYVEIMLNKGIKLNFRYYSLLLEMLKNTVIIENETIEENFHRFTEILNLLFPNIQNSIYTDF